MATSTVNGHTLPTDGNWSDGVSAEKTGLTTAIRTIAAAIDSTGHIDTGAIDVASTIGVFNSTTQGYGVALTRVSPATSAFRVYSDDAGAVLTGTGSVPDIRGGMSRVLLTMDNSGGHIRVFGLQGLVKGYDAEWGTEQVAGVQGMLELVRNTGTLNLAGYGKTSALLGTLSTSGALTVDANHLVAGVLALSNIRTAFTMTGFVAAFAADIYDATNWSDGTTRTKWPIGLYIPMRAATTGIKVGSWVASAATGAAFPFVTGMAKDADSGQLDVISAFGESSADLTSAYSAKVGRFRHLINGITCNHETYGLIGQVVCKNVTLGHLHAGLMGTLEVNTAMTVNGAYTYGAAGVIARLGVGTTITTATKAICGFIAFYNGEALVSGNAFAYATDAVGTAHWKAGLALEACDNVFYMSTASAYECGAKLASISGIPDTTASGVIRFSIGGTAYYIPFHTAASITGE